MSIAAREGAQPGEALKALLKSTPSRATRSKAGVRTKRQPYAEACGHDWSSEMANRIHSQLPGLSIIRDQVGARTRIRGVGQINGGGRKVELFVEEGDVHIRSGPTPRMVVMPSRQ